LDMLQCLPVAGYSHSQLLQLLGARNKINHSEFFQFVENVSDE
jgi:hypothetical protein